MSSWFNSLKESATAFTESAVKATEKAVESISHGPEQGGESQSNGSNPLGMLQKLTLSSPELMAERQQLDEQEKRKEQVRDQLAGLLPWETRDPERDILVEECKEAILQLSAKSETFFGPFAMPNSNEDTGAEGEDATPNGTRNVTTTLPPSAESLERLSKLQPLPKLLSDFDLDAHVGLIQRVLEVDPALVHAQSQWSGGGAREILFWKNYFFHCAFSRYEAGLSVDEVWSKEAIQRNDLEKQQQLEAEKAKKKASLPQSLQAATKSVMTHLAATTAAAAEAVTDTVVESSITNDPEHEISFEADSNTEPVSSTSNETATDPATEDAASGSATAAGSEPVSSTTGREAAPETTTTTPTSADASSTDYELVEDSQDSTGAAAASAPTVKTESLAVYDKDQGNEDDDVVDLAAVDYEDPELDELEAEIARELED